MQQSNPLNSAISSNRAMYQQMTQPSIASNKAHLVNSYYGDKTQYYNDQVAIKKEQRKKFSKFATIGFAVLATLGILGNMYYQIARKHVNFGKLTDDAKDNFSNVVHLFMNIDMAKNNLWKNWSHKISTKTPINTEKWFDEPIEKLYSGLGKFFNNKKYEKSVKILQENSKVLNLQNLPQSGEYAKWFDEQGKIISQRIDNADEHAKDIFVQAYKTFKENKDSTGFIVRARKAMDTFLNNGKAEIIEDRCLKDLYDTQTTSKTLQYLKDLNVSDDKIQLLSSDNIFDLFKKRKAKKELVETIAKKLGNNQENRQKTAKQIANSLVNIHKITSSGAREVIEKQRDIRLGNNSVEALTNIGTIGWLAASVASSDTKEERKSKILNTGIPLIGTLGFSSIGGVLNIAGAKAAIIGLISGWGVSLAAKKIDESIKSNIEQV